MDSNRTPRLRYIDAGDMEDSRIDFDGLDVHSPDGDKIGDVDGFVVDLETNRPYYVVVDSGGWFTSQRYLVPVGHARLDTDNDSLRLDINRDTITRFPPFDTDRFERLPEEEARRFNEQTLQACCPNELKGRQLEGRWDYEAWSHYRTPDWWQTRPVGRVTASPGTTDRLTSHPTSEARSEAPRIPPPSSATPLREQVVAGRTGSDLDETLNDRPLDPVTDRAEPGDVIGIEHEGRTTELGDTPKDEKPGRRE